VKNLIKVKEIQKEKIKVREAFGVCKDCPSYGYSKGIYKVNLHILVRIWCNLVGGVVHAVRDVVSVEECPIRKRVEKKKKHMIKKIKAMHHEVK
jgi:hypothetical protein